MDALPVGWTDAIVDALPDSVLESLGLERADDAPPVPPPNLPGYAPLPDIGGGYQPPPEPPPTAATAASSSRGTGIAIAVGVGAVAALGLVALAWTRR